MSENFKHSAIFFNETPKDNFLSLGREERVEKSSLRLRETLERISGFNKELVRQFMQETMEDGGVFVYLSNIESFTYGFYETFDAERNSLGKSVILLLPLNYFLDYGSYLDVDIESMLSSTLGIVWQKAAEMDIARHKKETEGWKVTSISPIQESKLRRMVALK